MLDLSLFHNPRFTAASGSVSVAFFSLAGFIFLINQYFQFFKGFGPLSAGVHLLPVASSVAIASLVGTKLAVRVGTKQVVATGLLCLAAFFAWVSAASATTRYATIALQMLLAGTGMGLTSAPATVAIMGSRTERKGRRWISSQRRNTTARQHARRSHHRERLCVPLGQSADRRAPVGTPHATRQLCARLSRRGARHRRSPAHRRPPESRRGGPRRCLVRILRRPQRRLRRRRRGRARRSGNGRRPTPRPSRAPRRRREPGDVPGTTCCRGRVEPMTGARSSMSIGIGQSIAKGMRAVRRPPSQHRVRRIREQVHREEVARLTARLAAGERDQADAALELM